MYILLPTKDHGQHHYTRSEIALKNDQYQNAIESCNKAIELEPDHPMQRQFSLPWCDTFLCRFGGERIIINSSFLFLLVFVS